MADDLTMSDFIMRKGAVSILFELGVENRSFNELKESDTVLISPNTISKRLKEGQELGLVDRTVGDGRRRATIEYTLTPTGDGLLSQFEEVSDRYFDLKEEVSRLKRQMDEKQAEIRKLLSEEAGKKLKAHVEERRKQREAAEEAEEAAEPEEAAETSGEPEAAAPVDEEEAPDDEVPDEDAEGPEEEPVSVGDEPAAEAEAPDADGEPEPEDALAEQEAEAPDEEPEEVPGEGTSEEPEAAAAEPEEEEAPAEAPVDVEGSGEEPEESDDEAASLAEEMEQAVRKVQSSGSEAEAGADESGGPADALREELEGEPVPSTEVPETAEDYDEIVDQSVGGVQDRVKQGSLDLDKVIAAEKRNRNRTTLLEWLRQRQAAAEGTEEPDERAAARAKHAEDDEMGETPDDMDADEMQEELERLRDELDL